MNRKLFALVFALAGVVAAAPRSSSADPPTDPEVEKKIKTVQLLAEAYRTAELADTLKSPELYLAAADLVYRVKAGLPLGADKKDVTEFPAAADVPEVTDEDGKPIPGAKADPARPENLDHLLDDWKDTAGGLAAGLGIGTEFKTLWNKLKDRDYSKGVGARGALGGPKVINRTIGPKQTHTYTFSFLTHQPGAVAFQSTANCKVKMVIVENKAVKFDAAVRVAQYTWVPQGANRVKDFRVTVHNLQNAPVAYRVLTN